ncbi:MAG: transcriptional regulator NrdR [candidate division WOR-3 bacterium]|nr:transcriptional regulator NrdR [candidate division WOR-3 bacterium]MDH7518347.1 transcriptional regulator NrdR [bacterium]
MKCPFCDSVEDRVLDSRPSQDGTAIRRRRECTNCGKRFTTYEYVEQMPLMVVKRDGRREPYNRQKLLNGILLACRKRPISRAEIEKLIDFVETRLNEDCRVEVSSSELGELVLKQLLLIDPVAYVRFASVYRQFNSPEQFVEELENLKKGDQRGKTGETEP